MALPELSPASKLSATILPVSGSKTKVEAALPFGVYIDGAWTTSAIDNFKCGAADQVAYVYKKLGGDVLDVEITEQQVYAAYEESCLEYSYIVNIHQSKNILSNVLGGTTGTFDEDGQIIETTGSINKDTNLSIKYPKFDFAYARRINQGISEEVNIGGSIPVVTASFPLVDGVQDYDLQKIFGGAGAALSGSIDNTRILIKKVYYKTTAAMWNFYAYYGSLNVVGNLANYGQYADSSTFQVVPPWQNKLQAMSFEDNIKTRTSDYSYEIRNNVLRLYPTPGSRSPTNLWVEFTIPQDTWIENDESTIGINGINNMSTVPLQNIPYESINAIGKQWIRRFALALCKEMLGMIRSKFGSIPIPGNDVTLNGSDLVTQGKEEQSALRDELKETLDEMTYSKMMEGDAEILESASKINEKIPVLIFKG